MSINGATGLEDIALDLLPSAESVMLRGGFEPTREVMSQLSGAEWLWNLAWHGRGQDDVRQSVRHWLP